MSRRFFLCVMLAAILVVAASPAGAQSLTPAEREYAVKLLEASRDAMLKAIEGLTDEQWKWKPAPERWSVAECAEHIAATEAVLPQLLKQMMQAPAAPPPENRPKDEDVVRWVRDRGQRFQAPNEIQPSGRYPSREELVKSFTEGRRQLIEYVRTTEDELHSRTQAHPAGQLDGYQWILLVAGHTDRHLAQMKEVIAAEGFPRK
jgi:hypothetical protein